MGASALPFGCPSYEGLFQASSSVPSTIPARFAFGRAAVKNDAEANSGLGVKLVRLHLSRRKALFDALDRIAGIREIDGDVKL
jgi:hypothetical protein